MKKDTILKAIKYLKTMGINVVEQNGKVYVVTKGMSDEFLLELSQNEIEYRASLFDQYFTVNVDITYFNRGHSVKAYDECADNEVTNFCEATVEISVGEDEYVYDVKLEDVVSGDFRYHDVEVDIEIEKGDDEYMDAVYEGLMASAKNIFTFTDDKDAKEYVRTIIKKAVKEYCED